MKTIIFDIDGTITDMWPIERSVLLFMLGKKKTTVVEKMYRSGIKDTYTIYETLSKSRINKSRYRKIYNTSFALLEMKKQLPKPSKYPIVDWIKKNKDTYCFVYATGGQQRETEYVLKSFGLSKIFCLESSLNQNNYRFSKKTGLPFKKIKSKFPDCMLVTDSDSDCAGAILAEIEYVKVKPHQRIAPLD